MAGAARYLRSAPLRRLRHPLDDSPVWSLLGSALGALLALLVGLPVLLALAVLLPLTLAVRWLLLLLYWNRHRPLISTECDVSGGGGGGVGAESVRAHDCRWLGGAWRYSAMHAVLVLDSRLEVAALRQLVVARVLPAYPRLTHRLHKLPASAGAGGHCWLPDPQFDVANHVIAGPPVSTDPQVQSYVSSLLGEGLEPDKPPWELVVLPRAGIEPGTTAVLRVHRAVADGSALVTLLCHCLADVKIPLRPPAGSDESGGVCGRLAQAALVGPLALLLWLVIATRDRNLLTGPHAAWSGRHAISWSHAIALGKVTRVKQVTRSTVKCVLLSALAGALRLLLQSCGVRQPPDMKVVVPVDLRSTSAPVVVSLPVGVEGAVPRLWSTRRALRAMRRSGDAFVVYLATAALMTLLPAQSARTILSAFTDQKASLQFSCVVGPPGPLAVGGCPLRAIFPLLPPPPGLSVAVSALTYADQVYVTVATDTSLGPAGTIILGHLQQQVELMYSLLKNRRVPGETKAAYTTLYRFPDVTRSPVRELASRLTLVQGEVERLTRASSEPHTHDTERLHRLRAEFSHLLRELRKRKSLGDSTDPWEGGQWRRRRAMSCSFARRPSLAVATLRPASAVEAPISSTLAFAASTPSASSVFNINCVSESPSPLSSPKYAYLPLRENPSPTLTENNNRLSRGLYDEILSALSLDDCSFTIERDHTNAQSTPMPLRRFKSQTVLCSRTPETRTVCRSWSKLDDYGAAVESLSTFATKIRRLSMENLVTNRDLDLSVGRVMSTSVSAAPRRNTCSSLIRCVPNPEHSLPPAQPGNGYEYV